MKSARSHRPDDHGWPATCHDASGHARASRLPTGGRRRQAPTRSPIVTWCHRCHVCHNGFQHVQRNGLRTSRGGQLGAWEVSAMNDHYATHGLQEAQTTS